MSRPAFLVDNLMNPRLYPGHALSVSSTSSGTTVRSLSAGRRRRVLTGWMASALDTAAWVRVVFDQPRAFDCLWIDRDHVLGNVGLAMSDDGFATELALTTQTPPAHPSPNSGLRSGTMFRTTEGALVWYLGLHVAHEIEVRFPAMGAGLRPEVAGMMVGMLWGPTHALQKPMDFGRPSVLRQQFRSVFSQWTEGAMGSFRETSLRVLASSFWEAEIGGLHIEDLYGSRGHGMVVFPDDDAAERALFGFAPPGSIGFRVEPGRDWSYPQAEIPVAEEDPVIR